MTHKGRVALVFGVGAALLGGAVPAGAQNVTAAAIRREVRRYVRAFSAGDAAALGALYAHIPAVTSLADGDLSLGWDSIVAGYADFFDANGPIAMRTDSVVVVPVDSGTAIAVFRARWDYQDDPDSIPVLGVVSIVYRHTGRGWRIIHDHTSSLVDDDSTDATVHVRRTAAVSLCRERSRRCRNVIRFSRKP